MTTLQKHAAPIRIPTWLFYIGLVLLAALIGLISIIPILGIALIGLLLALAGAWLIWQKPIASAMVMMTLLPFHGLAIRFVQVDLGLPGILIQALSMWKEGVLLILLLRVFLARGSFKFTLLDLLIVLYMGLSFLYIFKSEYLVLGAYGFRGTVEPFLFYFLARRLPMDSETVARLLRWLFIAAMLIALFGFIQAFILGVPFLIKYYLAADGTLSSSHTTWIAGRLFVRASSTFTSPNSMGMYLAILMLIGCGVWSQVRIGFIKFALVSMTLLSGLLITMSRSSWVAFGTGFIMLFLLRRKIKRSILIGSSLIFLAAVPLVIRLNVVERLVETISLEDPSAAGKIPSILSGLNVVAQHPFGIGIGMAGPRSAAYLQELLFHSENYYVLMAMELGIIGLLLYLAIMVAAILQLNHSWLHLRSPIFKGIALGVTLGFIGASLGVMFIPSLQELIVSSLLWFFIGVGIRAGFTPSPEPQETTS